MSKDQIIQVKVSEDDKKLIKKFGGSPTKIWWMGFEKWIEEIPEILREKAEYHHNLYLRCNDKLANCNDVVSTRKSKLDQVCMQYLETGRPVDTSDSMDFSWIEAKLQKEHLAHDVDTFLNRCRELKEQGVSP